MPRVPRIIAPTNRSTAIERFPACGRCPKRITDHADGSIEVRSYVLYLHYQRPGRCQEGSAQADDSLGQLHTVPRTQTSVLPSLLDSLWCSNGESLTVAGHFVPRTLSYPGNMPTNGRVPNRDAPNDERRDLSATGYPAPRSCRAWEAAVLRSIRGTVPRQVESDEKQLPPAPPRPTAHDDKRTTDPPMRTKRSRRGMVPSKRNGVGESGDEEKTG